MQQIPHGPKDRWCPFWRKRMCDVCHTCPMWTLVRGTNPQTGESVDQWNCAMAIMPVLTIEVAQQARQSAAATESFRNEVVKRADRKPTNAQLTYNAHNVPPPQQLTAS